MNEPGLIERLLTSARTIAVVGYTGKPGRPVTTVSEYLRSQGYRIVPVDPRLGHATIEGEQAYDRLADIPKDVNVDVVDVFKRGELLDEVVDDAIAAGARVIWFQLDLGNVAAAERAERAGMQVVWDHCMKVEHRRMRARRRLEDAGTTA